MQEAVGHRVGQYKSILCYILRPYLPLSMCVMNVMGLLTIAEVFHNALDKVKARQLLKC